MKNLTNFVIAVIAVFVITASVSAQISSATSGNWNTGSTWVGGVVPTSADNVTIAATHTVTVDVNTAACNNISFGATTSKLAMGTGSVLSVYGNFTLNATTHIVFSSWTSGAKIKFTGSAATQTLSNWATGTGIGTAFMEMQVDKSAGKLTTSASGMRLNLGTSLEVINGTFEFASTDDIYGRDNAGTATTPTITVASGATLSFLGGGQHIMSGTTLGTPIGKMTISGTVNVATTSTNKIAIGGIDIENGGTLRATTGWSSNLFIPGTINVKSGGTLRLSTITNIWDASTVINLNLGGIVNVTATGTIAALPNLTNSGIFRYSYQTQTILGLVYNDLYLEDINVKTLGGNTTVNGTLQIKESASLALGGFSLTYGANATLQYGASGQTVTQTTADPEWPAIGGPQNVAIYNNAGVTLHDNRTVNGTLTLTYGTFDNNGSADDKVLTIANNANVSRARGALAVAPTFTGVVNVAYTSGLVDVITGYELPISSSVLNNLTINTAKVVQLNADATVNGALILTNGILSLGSNNLTLAASSTILGTPSITSMVAPEGMGELRKVFTGTGSFTYPVGDSTGTREYTPVTLNFTSGDFSSAYAGVKLVNAKHPYNYSVNDYLKRYWTVNQSGISGFSCDVTCEYVVGDVTGAETNITAGKLDAGTWSYFGSVDNVNHKYTATGCTSFSDFSGGENGAMPIQLSSFVGSYVGNSAKLDWQTISEVNNYGFNVQRKSGIKFVTIGFVAGKGTSLEPQRYNFVDEKASGSVGYRLEQIDNNGLKNYFGPIFINPNSVDDMSVPAVFVLNQNYPNPFNPSTKIRYSLANSGYTTLKVYNILGKEVATLFEGNAEAGKLYTVNFDAKNLTSGLYFSKLVSSNSVEVKKMTLIK